VLTATAVPTLVAHTGAPLAPHDLWTAWRFDPFVGVALVVTGTVYLRGWRPPDGRARAYAFVTGLLVVALAVLSPIEAAAGTLLSAHMVQHLLLVVVAAPLLAVSAPGAALLRGTPVVVRRRFVAARRGVGLDAGRLRHLRHPAARWLLFVVTFWSWHASALYSAAVDSEVVHALEHVTFLGTAVLVWSVIVGHPSIRLPPFLGVVAVFGLALQAVFLSALLTFSPTPWYEPYAAPPPGWGLDALADQHLAGVIMWVPSGLFHTAVGIGLMVRWLNAHDDRRLGTTPP